MPKPKAVTEAEFDKEVLKSDLPVLVDFWAEWCYPCHLIAPIVEEIAHEYEGRLKVVKVDVDQAPGLASRLGIMSIPTLMLFKDGREVERIVGAVPKRMLEEVLQRLLGEG